MPLANVRRPLGVVVALAALLPLPAYAHGLSRNTENLSTSEFLPLGIKHMLLGWDHLLFILGVLLIAKSWKPAAGLITAFVVGHSITLIVGTQAGWVFPAALIDAIIGISVLGVGTMLAMGVEISPRQALPVVLGFGLIHGLGLATRIADLNLPREGLMAKVLNFNLGLEIGQLIAIGVMSAIGVLILRTRPNGLKSITTTLGAVIAAGGALAMVMGFYYLAAPRVGAPTNFSPPAAGGCELAANVEDLNIGDTAPSAQFYPPGESVGAPLLGHAKSDGYLIVEYPQNADEAVVTEIEEYVKSEDGKGVIAVPSPGSEFVMTTYREVLTCTSWETETVNSFAEKWFATL